MKFIKFIFKKSYTNLFFIISFTFTILTFSLGNSIISNQSKLTLSYNPKNNKALHFETKYDLNLSEVKTLLKDAKITLTLMLLDRDSYTEVSTIPLSNGLEHKLYIKSGSNFTKDDYLTNDNIALISNSLADSPVSLKGYNAVPIKLSSKGVFYEIGSKVVVPESTFFYLLNTSDLTSEKLSFLISGEENDLNNAISTLKSFLLSKDSESKIEVFDYMRENKTTEANSLYKAGMLVVLITLINSLTLSLLWIEGNKKSIALRKTLGATDTDIYKLFLFELITLSLISVLISILLQFLIINRTSGYLFNLDISFNKKTFIYSLILSLGTAFIVSSPSLKYLNNVKPSNLLRRD